MLVRVLALFFAFGAIVTNAASVEARDDTASVELPDAAVAFDSAREPTAGSDNTRNTTFAKEGFCGAHLSDEAFNTAESEFKELVDSGKSLVPADNGTLSARARIVNVYWHVVYTTGNRGVISANLIRFNIDSLNRYYARANLQFRLARVDYIYSPRWFAYASIEYFSEWLALGRYSRRGGVGDLNLWSTGMTYSSYGGYSRFPWEYRSYPAADGALLRYDLLASGKLVVHEVGHWVGLYHTFQGGCFGAGDGVSDTPAEASPASGCPTGRDTCSSPGLDPIFNHMDYSSDSCRNQFTRGQITRMRLQCRAYRGLIF